MWHLELDSSDAILSKYFSYLKSLLIRWIVEKYLK